MAGRLPDEGWARIDRRLTKLEDAMEVTRLSPEELPNALHELLDLKRLFYVQMNTRPTIKEAWPKYRDVIKIADDQEGGTNNKGTFGLKSEIILNELPRLRGLSSATESMEQLAPILALKAFPDLAQQTISLRKIKDELLVLNKKLDDMEKIRKALSEAEITMVSLTEGKLADIDDRLS